MVKITILERMDNKKSRFVYNRCYNFAKKRKLKFEVYIDDKTNYPFGYDGNIYFPTINKYVEFEYSVNVNRREKLVMNIFFKRKDVKLLDKNLN